MSMWINNAHLAPPACGLLPDIGAEILCDLCTAVCDSSLLLPPGQLAVHRKYTFFSTAQCRKFHMARSVGKSAEFWGNKPIWLLDLTYSPIYYLTSYKNDILISII